MIRKLRLILCVLGWHSKRMCVGGYRCLWCGKYCGGRVPEPWKRKYKRLSTDQEVLLLRQFIKRMNEKKGNKYWQIKGCRF